MVIGCLLGVSTGPPDACVLCRQLFYCHPHLPSRSLPRSLSQYFIVMMLATSIRSVTTGVNICTCEVRKVLRRCQERSQKTSGKISENIRKVLRKCQESSQKMSGKISENIRKVLRRCQESSQKTSGKFSEDVRKHSPVLSTFHTPYS